MMSQIPTDSPSTSASRSRKVPLAALRLAMWIGVISSLALAVLAMIQSDAISERIRQIEEPYTGATQAADSGSFVITAVLIVAALNLIGWVLSVTVFAKNLRHARIWGVLGFVVGLALAVTMLIITEYGERIYPMSFGLLALIPCIAGIWALVALFRARRA